MAEDPTSSRHIAVCLSGGGHRAALFGCGAMLYLVDAGKAADIGTISSISGGSLTNGTIAQRVDLGHTDPAAFRAEVAPLVRACSVGGTLLVDPLLWIYLVAVGLVGLGGAGAGIWWWRSGSPGWGLLVVIVALLVAAAALTRRGWFCQHAYDRALFHAGTLADTQTGVDHVICAADPQTCEAVYFAGRFLYSYRLGWGRPAGLTVARAVQASTSVPGGFFARGLNPAEFGFQHPEAVRRMLLMDGGIYDNMGTEWPLELRRRCRQVPDPGPVTRTVSEVVVVNASAGEGVRQMTRQRWPVVGEILQLLAAESVMYDQTTSVRRRLLYRMFTHPGPDDPRGAIAQIDASPRALPLSFAGGGDEAAQRARAALAVLAAVPDDEWDADARADAAVGTTLWGIPADRAARLLRHSWALTMANCHVLLAYPLLPVPSLAEFERLTQ